MTVAVTGPGVWGALRAHAAETAQNNTATHSHAVSHLTPAPTMDSCMSRTHQSRIPPHEDTPCWSNAASPERVSALWTQWTRRDAVAGESAGRLCDE
jgi:hypothetical protein